MRRKWLKDVSIALFSGTVDVEYDVAIFIAHRHKISNRNIVHCTLHIVGAKRSKV